MQPEGVGSSLRFMSTVLLSYPLILLRSCFRGGTCQPLLESDISCCIRTSSCPPTNQSSNLLKFLSRNDLSRPYCGCRIMCYMRSRAWKRVWEGSSHICAPQCRCVRSMAFISVKMLIQTGCLWSLRKLSEFQDTLS